MTLTPTMVRTLRFVVSKGGQCPELAGQRGFNAGVARALVRRGYLEFVDGPEDWYWLVRITDAGTRALAEVTE